MICDMTFFDLDLTLTWPWHEVNLELDLSRSCHTSFEAPRREEYDGVRKKSSYLSYFQKYKPKTFWVLWRSLTFDDLWSLNYWPEVKSEDTLAKSVSRGVDFLLQIVSSCHSSWAMASCLKPWFWCENLTNDPTLWRHCDVTWAWICMKFCTDMR